MNVDLISGPLIWHWHDPQKKPHGRLLLLKRGLDVPGRANLNPACRPHPESHSGRLLQVPHCASGYSTGSPLVAGLYGTLYHMGLQIGLRHSLDWQHDLTGPLPLPNPMKSPLPFSFVLPLGLGWARYRAEGSGLFSGEMGVALNTTAGIVILSAVVIGIAGSIERRDEELRRVDEVSLKERSRAQELMAQLQRTNEALQSEIAELRKKGS